MNENQITMHFGGGALYLKCHNCSSEIGSEEVDFPGTPEQQEEPRRKLLEKKKIHLEKCKILMKMIF